MKPRVYLRANGNEVIGLGHIIRIKSLKSMIQEKFECVYLLREEDQQARLILDDASQIVIPPHKDLQEEAKWIASNCLKGAELVVLDGYSFNTEYQKSLRDRCAGLVFIDDIKAFHFVADLVINHIDGITHADYSAEPYTRFLLGFKYCILRQSFIRQAKQGISKKEEKNTLICLGGADPENHTKRILEQLITTLQDTSFQIVVGAANPHLIEMKTIAERNSNVKVYYSLNEIEMALLMRNAAIAVLSPSTVALEYLCSGGNLYLFPIADNQLPLYELLIEKGYARSFKDLISTDFESSFLFQNKPLIDGKSPERICEAFQTLV